MDERNNLTAFLATLGAIVVLFIISSVLAYNGKSVEAIGIGAVMTGLIGVLGTFRPRGAAPSDAPPLKVDPDAKVDTRKNPDGSTTQTITGADGLDGGELPESDKL